MSPTASSSCRALLCAATIQFNRDRSSPPTVPVFVPTLAVNDAKRRTLVVRCSLIFQQLAFLVSHSFAPPRDSKSRALHWACGFDPHLQHQRGDLINRPSDLRIVPSRRCSLSRSSLRPWLPGLPSHNLRPPASSGASRSNSSSNPPIQAQRRWLALASSQSRPRDNTASACGRITSRSSALLPQTCT
jgi:hypothetical protein